MSTTRAIAHNTGIQIAGKIISTFLGLLAVAIMTRSLGVEAFGWFVTATSFLQFVGIMSDFGFTLVTANLLSQPELDQQKVLNNLFTWRFITATIVCALAAAVIFLFPYRIEIKIAVAVNAIAIWAASLNQVFIGLYQVRLRMIVVTVGEIMGRVLLVLGVTFVALEGRGFIPMVIAASAAPLIFTAYLAYRSNGVRFAFDRDISRLIFTRMWPTALAIFFNALYLQGDRVILPLFVSQAEVGLYGAAYRVLDLVLQVTAMVAGIMLPLMSYAWSRGERELFRHHYQMAFDFITLLLLPMLVGIALLSTQLITFVAGSAFAAAGPILRLLSIAILGYCFGMTFGHVIQAINRQREAIFVFLIDAILSIVGYFVFIPRFGVAGAIGVTIFSELFAGAGLYVIATHYAGIHPRFTTFFKILAASAIMGLSIQFAQPLPLFASIILGAAVYSILVIVFRIVSSATLREVLRMSPSVVTKE